MRALISIARFRPGRTFGAETYLRAVLRGLANAESGVDITVTGSREAADWVRGCAPGLRTYTPRALRTPAWGHHFEGWVVRRAIRVTRPEVVFFPFNIMPTVSLPSVLMVHDLVSFFYRERFPKVMCWKFRLLSVMVARSIRRASVVVTPTAAIADEIRARIHGAPERIAPILEAANLPAVNGDIPALRSEFREPHVLLQTGSKLPHKAQEVGVRAFRELLDTTPELVGRVRLVVTGCSEADAQSLRTLLAGSAASTHLSALGKVSDEKLAALTRRATAVLFPTLYEGFGLGVVEAQASGKAVVASDIPVLREVSRGHAEFFTPESPSAMAVAIRRVLMDERRRAKLEGQGPAIAASWSWDDHARSLLQVLRLAAEV